MYYYLNIYLLSIFLCLLQNRKQLLDHYKLYYILLDNF